MMPHSAHRLNDIPDTAYVPLKFAHLLVGKSRTTVYRWYQEDRLTTRDIGRGTEVLAGQVKELALRMIEQRKRRKR